MSKAIWRVSTTHELVPAVQRVGQVGLQSRFGSPFALLKQKVTFDSQADLGTGLGSVASAGAARPSAISLRLQLLLKFGEVPICSGHARTGNGGLCHSRELCSSALLRLAVQWCVQLLQATPGHKTPPR